MYQSRVFLEVRILVPGAEKAFCPCRVGADADAGTCPVCRRESGAHPVINPQAARTAYTIAHALDCALAERAAYERPEGAPALPPEHSLSGASVKIGSDGYMDIEFHRRRKRVTIREVRIEEDAGRLTHLDGEARMDYSRAGAPSIRIRTGTELELGEEAEILLTELRRRIQYMGVLKGTSFESAIRCNAYVALATYPAEPDYTVKLRNLNSFNFARKAINAELRRQEEILASGGAVVSESRLWNEKQDRTEFYQSRESVSTLKAGPIDGSPEYRCPPALLAELRASAVEHPSERQARLMDTWGISRPRAEFICDEKSRADFFEQTIAAGADAMDTAHWLMSDVTGLLRRADLSVQESPLSPRRFAAILGHYHAGRIHSRIAKQLLQAVIETDRDPDDLMKEHNWSQITDPAQLRLLVERAVHENEPEAARLREGDMAPLEFLTGFVMKKTRGLADPATVKALLKEELRISVVYVLSMGGTISAKVDASGEVSGGDAAALKAMLDPAEAGGSVSFEDVPVGSLLSEEIQPADWAALVHAVAARVASGTANGIVVAHGTDTLAYTAPLLYWLFADSGVPIVLTASTSPPSAGDEARSNLNRAVRLAREKSGGVYVVFGDRVLSPVNLKFVRSSPAGFTNWNMGEPIFTGSGFLAGALETDRYVMTRVLSEAADRLFLCRVFPGLRADRLLSLVDEGVTTFILELYEKGTGNMKEGPYSLKRLLTQGRKRGCRFYCTSQQEGVVDLSGYSTARRMWREGAVPMGALTTETAVALYFAASLVCDSDEELDQIMESGGPS